MKLLFTTAALIASIGSAHAADIVTDGGFESITQAAGSSDVYTTLPGWTTVAGPGIEVRNQDAGNAFEGQNFVELDSSANSSMIQTLSTVAGTSYTVSFEYSAREGTPASTNPIDVLWNGQLLGTPTLDGTNQSGNVWQAYSYTVTGTGSDVLEFAAAGTSDGLGGSLDAVSVDGATVAAVPEPSTVSLMFGGLAMVGAALRHRRAQR